MTTCACRDPSCLIHGCKNAGVTWPGSYPWAPMTAPPNYIPTPPPVTYPTPRDYPLPAPVPRGCICPPTSEQTCQSPTCPRKGIKP